MYLGSFFCVLISTDREGRKVDILNIVRSKDVSLKAKGLFWVIFQAMEDHNGYVDQEIIKSYLHEGQVGFETPYKELKTKGYLKVTADRSKGRVKYTYKLIFDPEIEV